AVPSSVWFAGVLARLCADDDAVPLLILFFNDLLINLLDFLERTRNGVGSESSVSLSWLTTWFFHNAVRLSVASADSSYSVGVNIIYIEMYQQNCLLSVESQGP